jgi:hypothetical protein
LDAAGGVAADGDASVVEGNVYSDAGAGAGADGAGVDAALAGGVTGDACGGWPGAGTATPGASGLSSMGATFDTKCRVSPKQVVGKPTLSS